MTPGRGLRTIAGVLLLTPVLVGCSTSVTVAPAPSSTSPGCAAVVVRLPRTIDGAAMRSTDSQGTSAWGTPPTVELRCGTPSLGPTTLPCITVGGVDWIDLRPGSRLRTFRTFGREPTTDVTLDAHAVDPVAALEPISGSIRIALPATSRRCS